MSKERMQKEESEPKSNFTFITTNKEKIESARRHLNKVGLSFATQSLDLTEVQSDDAENIAVLKAEEAYQRTHVPIIISDHNWQIPALGGFPGPYMKFINQWLSTQDIQNLIKPYQDRTIVKTEILCYRDQKGLQVFKCDMRGVILDEARGEGLPVMRVVSLMPDGKTVAECISEGIDMSPDYTIWEDFAAWYKTANS